MRRPRRLVLSVAALGLAVSASGCAYLSPVQTHDFYQTADGTNATLEEAGEWTAGVRNAFLVVAEDDTVEMYGSAVNYTDAKVTVELEGLTDSGVAFSTEVPVPAHETVELGPGPGQHPVAIDGLDVPAGAVMELSVSAGGRSTVITLPVTDTSLSHHQKDAGVPAQD